MDISALIIAELEAAAHELETRGGNKLYQAAWRAGAKLIRARKQKYEQTANHETAQTL